MRTTDVAGGRGNNKHSTLNMRFLVKLLHFGHRDANITHRTLIERYDMLQYIYNHTHTFKQCLLLPQGVLYPLTYKQYFGQRDKSDTDHRSTRVLILKKKHVYGIPHSQITSLEKMNRCEYCWLYRQLFYSEVVRTSLILPEL